MIGFREFLTEVNLSSSFLEMRGPRHVGKYITPFLSKSGIEKTKRAFRGTGTPVEKIDSGGHGSMHDPKAASTHILGSEHNGHAAGTPIKITHVIHKDEKTILARTESHGDIPLSKIQKPKALATKRRGSYGFDIEGRVAKNLGIKAAGSSNKSKDFELDHPDQKADDKPTVRGRVKVVEKPKRKFVRGESKLEKGRFGVTSLQHKDGQWGFTGDPKMHEVFAKATVNGVSLLEHLNKNFPNGKITKGFRVTPHPGTAHHYLQQSDVNVLHIHDKSSGNSTTFTIGNSLKGRTSLGHLSHKEIGELDGTISVEPSAKGKGRIAHSPNIAKMRELAARSAEDTSHRTLENAQHGAEFVKGLRKIKLNEEMSVGAGVIAGLEPDTPPVPKGVTTKGSMLRRKKFAGKEVFVVSSDAFNKAKLGKKKFEHYSSYVGRDETGEAIRQYAKENRDAPIIIEDELTGAMVYLKYGKR